MGCDILSYTYDQIINQGLLLDLRFKEGTGTITRDWAKPHHANPTLAGTPAWTAGGVGAKLQVLDFNAAHPDSVQCLAADTADLNFNPGSSYTAMVWIFPDIFIAGYTNIMSRGSRAVDGWGFYQVSGAYIFSLYNEARGSPLNISEWQLITYVKVGLNAYLYRNDSEMSYVAHYGVNTANSAEPLNIGGLSTGANQGFDGKMYRPRVWNRALSLLEINYIFNTERKLFGV